MDWIPEQMEGILPREATGAVSVQGGVGSSMLVAVLEVLIATDLGETWINYEIVMNVTAPLMT